MTFLELLHKEQVAIIIFSCCFGAILLDWLACLPTEIKYIYSVDLKNLAHGKLPTLPSFLLFVPRLLTIPLVALCYALVLGRTVECTMMWKILLSIYSICTINSFTIFAVRTIVSRSSCFYQLYINSLSSIAIIAKAIRNSRRPMICFLVFLLTAQSTVLLWWLFSADFPPQLQITDTVSICGGLGLGSFSWTLFLYFGSSELIILSLTLFDRNWTHTKIKFETVYSVWRSEKTSVTQQFYCHTIVYFVLQIAFLYAEAIWFYYYGHDHIFGILTAPL